PPAHDEQGRCSHGAKIDAGQIGAAATGDHGRDSFRLAGRCWDCHEKKTEADRQAGLLGRKGDGKRSRGKREPP
ncbi:MAG TPA: hypothetical protein VGF64_04970, partial [Acidimicrobiales bacterium]